MTKIVLSYVQRFKDRHGKLRHYFRRPGFKRTPLPGLPGSAEFMAAYSEAERASRSVAEERTSPGSIAALIVGYYQSAAFRSLQPQTQRTSRLILDRFRDDFGDLPARKLESRHLRTIFDAMADRPSAAKNLLKRLRAVCKFGVERGLLQSDPTQGVRVVVPKSEGFRAWSEEDIARFEATWPEGSRARLALYLLLYTGQRRSDVVRMGWQHLTGDALEFTQKKTGVRLIIPLHRRLGDELARCATGNLTFLMTAHNGPFTPEGFSNWFSECARKAGLPPSSTPHGLRKAAARRLAEAGCSVLEIAAITGHASLKEVERYTKSAEQRRLAQAAMRAIGHV